MHKLETKKSKFRVCPRCHTITILAKCPYCEIFVATRKEVIGEEVDAKLAEIEKEKRRQRRLKRKQKYAKA